ncbi:hypothetical protein A2U01_0079236, partial [Trifolium medium]|nr:hypothetical protein [Trifolium medium]
MPKIPVKVELRIIFLHRIPIKTDDHPGMLVLLGSLVDDALPLVR